MKSAQEVQKWYDSFTSKQVNVGVNLRHYKIMEHLVASGLKQSDTVLEIGCGIGTLTGLLSKYLKKGELVATDISPESINIAKKQLSVRKNTQFLVSDTSDLRYPKKFDFIVLPDVLEHIPIEQHRNLFKVMADHMHDTSIIFIHIPHPKALDYIRANTPEKLQIIDQSINASELLQDAYSNGLILISYTSHSVFNQQHDYAFIKLKKETEVVLTSLSKPTIIRRKLISRIKFYWASI